MCFPFPTDTPQEAYSVARQFNMIPPVCEQAEYHLFQREKVEVQLPELYHKIGNACTFNIHNRMRKNSFWYKEYVYAEILIASTIQ